MRSFVGLIAVAILLVFALLAVAFLRDAQLPTIP